MGRTRKKDTDLPKGIYRHGKKYRQLVVINGKRTWRPLESITLAEENKKIKDGGPRTHLFTGGMTYKRFISMIASIKSGASARGIKFSLTEIDFSNLIARANGRCEVSGIPFIYEQENKKWSKNPWAPSIDRIDSSEGYYIENCRVVCIAVNVALNEWGDDVLKKIAVGICGKNIPTGNTGAEKMETQPPMQDTNT
jgi:hypothetical protein